MKHIILITDNHFGKAESNLKSHRSQEPLIHTEMEALAFVKRHGLATVFPIKGTRFPNLYSSTAGEDKKEKLEKTWNWADNLAQQKKLYYGKLVAKQTTLVSLEVFPHVFRLHHMKGKLSETAKQIMDALVQHGPISTSNLRKQLQLTGKERKSMFTQAIDQLQLNLAIAIVNREKSPRMIYTWDLIERWMPKELIEKAARTSESEARDKVVGRLLEIGAITKPEEAAKLLGWQR